MLTWLDLTWLWFGSISCGIVYSFIYLTSPTTTATGHFFPPVCLHFDCGVDSYWFVTVCSITICVKWIPNSIPTASTLYIELPPKITHYDQMISCKLCVCVCDFRSINWSQCNIDLATAEPKKSTLYTRECVYIRNVLIFVIFIILLISVSKWISGCFKRF